MNLIESVRNLFKPIEHEVIAEGMLVNDKHYEDLMRRRDEVEFITPRPRPPKPGSLIVAVKHYEDLILRRDKTEIDKAWNAAEKYGLPTNPSPFISDYPVYAACTTAMEDYPFQIGERVSMKITPLADWECEWCGNMWASDIKSCEKCGGPKA